MKTVMIANIIIKSVFALCVTMAAIYFKNAWILWWFMIVPFIGYDYKETPTKKGADNDRAD